MLKAQCGTCAYTVRVSRTWLCEGGAPVCPVCHPPIEGLVAMECAQWDEIMDDAQRAAAEGERGRGRIVRVSRVTLRLDRDCDGCGGRMAAGQPCRRTVYTLGGALSEEDLCDACADPASGRAYSGGTMGDERWRATF